MTTYRVNTDAAADLEPIRAELQRNYAASEWIAARDAIYWAVKRSVDEVTRARQLAKLLSRPTGEPKSAKELLTLVVQGARNEVERVVRDGTEREFADKVGRSATDLSSSLDALLRDVYDLKRLDDLRVAQQAMRQITQISLARVQRTAAAYGLAARQAEQDLSLVNRYQREIDAVMRQSCR